MRKLILVAALAGLLAGPARATELVINYPSDQALATLSQALGYWDPVNRTVTANGGIVTGGSYFFNAVGTVSEPTGATTTDGQGNTVPVMASLPGKWARLRHNGDPAILNAQMTPATIAAAAQLGISIYQNSPTLGCWTADGATCAPDYIGTIALIM